MLKFYTICSKTYHNDTLINSKFCGYSLQEERESNLEVHLITWENLKKKYQELAFDCSFNIWNFKKGRRVSFFFDSLFPRNKEFFDVKEWKSPLNIRVEKKYTEYEPSIDFVLKWFDSEKAIKYLNEKKLKIL